MAHAGFVQERIDQIESLLSQGVRFEEIVETLKSSGFMIIHGNKDTTEDWVFDQCLILLARHLQSKQIEEDFDVSDEGFDPYSNCYTDDC